MEKKLESQIRPKLSIITVNYNDNEGLKRTLQSIKSQTFKDYEHIIIDAASTDGSVDTIQSYAAETELLTFWVSEKDKGIYDGMNKGIRHARGEYLIFMNAGDSFFPDVLKQIDFDGTQYIYGDMLLDLGDRQMKRIAPELPDLFFFAMDSLSHQSCFIHRTLFEGREYDLKYKIVADWAHSFQSIVFEGCSFKHIPLYISKCDGTGVSSVYKDVQSERVQWMESHLSKPMLLSIADLILYHTVRCHKIAPLLVQTRKFKKHVISAVKLISYIYILPKHHRYRKPNFSIHDILMNHWRIYK